MTPTEEQGRLLRPETTTSPSASPSPVSTKNQLENEAPVAHKALDALTQKRPQRAFVTPDSALDLGRLMHALPRDVIKKVSCHDLKRICENYNTIPCPNCYGGHQRPCQWCGDSGSVVFEPDADLPTK